MINARFIPLDTWPGRPTPPAKQRSATFRASYRDTLELLERELEKLNARDITVQAYFRVEQIRNDGWPMNSAEPNQSGVVLSFRSFLSIPPSPLSFPCDTFDTYDDNLRAI